MSNEIIGVGIISASPLNPSSWAMNAHVPAINALAEAYEINAVSTRNIDILIDSNYKAHITSFN